MSDIAKKLRELPPKYRGVPMYSVPGCSRQTYDAMVSFYELLPEIADVIEAAEKIELLWCESYCEPESCLTKDIDEPDSWCLSCALRNPHDALARKLGAK